MAATDVVVARAGREILAGVSLAVSFGSVVAVEGTNGSGKTSLLRVLAGLAAPAAGALYRSEGPCVFVPERLALAPRLTPLDWLGKMDALRRVHRPWPATAAAWGLDGAVLKQPVRALSKGNLQRVVLCEALTARVRLAVLDEPWTGLDAGARELLADALGARANDGWAIVVTDQSGARRRTLPADMVWRVGEGAVVEAPEVAAHARVLVVARRAGVRVAHTVACGAHDALLAELLAAGWSIETVRPG